MLSEGYRPGGGESWRDPWPMYATLRDHDPVHHVQHSGYWVLSRYDDVLAARWLGLDPAAGAGLILDTGTLSVLSKERGTPAIRLWNGLPR